MTASMNRIQAALNLPTSTPALLNVARHIVDVMTGNPSFPAPVPSIAEVAAAVADLETAEVETGLRTRGAATVRNEKRAVVVALLTRLKAYVQGVADGDVDGAPAIIEGAGMNVKRKVSATKPPFEVKTGRVSGSVRLVARAAGDRAAYEWAWSTDAGTTWHVAPTTTQASTELAGLPVATTCSFRYRVLTLAGQGDWSNPTLLVIR